MDSAVRELVRARAGDRCEYCRLGQARDAFHPFHVEHIVARQHRGSDDPANAFSMEVSPFVRVTGCKCQGSPVPPSASWVAVCRARRRGGLAKADRVRQGKGMSAIEQIEKTVLALPVEQRVLLVESLLGSLPPAGKEWSEADELAEVERREQEIASGRVQPVNDAEFWRRVEARRQR